MKSPKNYKELTDRMLLLFNNIDNGSETIDKANTLIKTSNAIVNIQRAKIMSTKVTGEKKIIFFEE